MGRQTISSHDGKKVFDKVILPEFITRKSHPIIENKVKLHFLCRIPSFPSMLACVNEVSKI